MPKNVAVLLPRSANGQAFLMQEECCWSASSRSTPNLPLRIAAARMADGCDVAILDMPLDPTHAEIDHLSVYDEIRLVHTWALGDELAQLVIDLARRYGHRVNLIANPYGSLGALGSVYSDCGRSIGDLDPERRLPISRVPASLWREWTRVLYQYATGCFYNCPFCVWQNRLHAKRPEIAADDIAALLQKIPNAFSDDSGDAMFLLGPSVTWSEAWLARLLARMPRVYWSADINVREIVAAPKIIPSLGRSGLRRVCMGIEFLTERLLERLGKGHSVAEAIGAMAQLQANDIRYRFSLRRGIGETLDDMNRLRMNLELMASHGLSPDHIYLGRMAEWPGVPWIDRLAPGAETENIGTERFTRRAVKITDELKEAWASTHDFCSAQGWTTPRTQ